MTRYFALTDDEKIVPLGEFDSIADAFDVEPPNSHWVFSEDGLRRLEKRIASALGDGEEEGY